MKLRPQSSATCTERMASSRVICRNSCPSEEAPKPSTGICKPVLPKMRCCIRRGVFNSEAPSRKTLFDWVGRRGVFSIGRFAPAFRSCSSRQDFLDHFAVDIREAPVAAIVAVDQLFVVDAQQVKNRGVQIVAIGLPRHRLPGPLVALA